MSKLSQYFSLLRISHWSKSVFVFLGFFYTPLSGYFIPAVFAALSFCLISSAVYIYNDLYDREEDLAHPLKKKRPLTSGSVSVYEALGLMCLLLVVGLFLGALISKALAWILVGYLLVNWSYNQLLKIIPVVDVLCIAVGFLLRVLAGTLGIGLSISVWLIVTATLLSLFIALNKRRLELRLNLKQNTRKVLKRYSPDVLNRLITGTGCSCFIIYFSYVIFIKEQSFYFILTLPFAAFALWRFAWLTMQKVVTDDPVDLFLHDNLSRFNLWCFAVLTFMALAQTH
ncbi:MAG: decaprenyl-phosphate phosphoribosyltransferase [Legionella sp.]|nr:MAG: decaprenyl-phosphate phosphoribosyltransferase [Legionella sp.]PJD99649.1 MAG: decaprenyl-phosphate phosphoribosyltransferase [Legionella sp.]